MTLSLDSTLSRIGTARLSLVAALPETGARQGPPYQEPYQDQEPDQDLLASLNAALAEAAEQNLRQREEIAVLKVDLMQREAGSPARLAGLEHVLSILRLALRKQTVQSDAFKGEHGTLLETTAVLRKLQAEHGHLKTGVLPKLLAEHDHLKTGVLPKLQAEHDSLGIVYATLLQTTEILQRRAEDAEAHYRDILNRNSWKITRPARVLIRLIRRK